MKNYVKYFFLALSLLMLASISSAQSVGGTTSGAATYCTTTNSGFVSLSGQNGNILNWQLSTDGGATWLNIGNTNPNQTYFNLNQTTCYRAVVKDGAFPADTSTIVCINVFPPAVAGALTGGGLFCGSNATGNLTLTGNNGPILNWEFSINNGLNWNPIANTTNTENIGGVTQTTLFRVIVQSGSCPSDTSNIDTVTVTPQTVPGSITGPGSVCNGSNSGNLLLTGYLGSVIGWRFSINSGATWTPIANTTSINAYLNLSQVTWYQAIVQNGGCSIDTTAIEIITVDPPTVSGSLSGGGTFCGTSATGTLTLAGYTGNILGWEFSTDGGITWNPIVNTTNTEPYTSLSQTTLYQVLVQSGACSILTSNIDTVFVTPQTVAGSITGPGSVCSGSNSGNLSLTGYLGSIIGWRFSINSGATWTPIANTTSSNAYLNLTQVTWYQAIVQSGGCSIDTTAIEIITVDPPAVSGSLNGGGTFCGTSATGTLTLAGYTGNILGWEFSTDGGATWNPIANTTSTEPYVSLSQTTLYQVLVQSGACPILTSNIDTVFVLPQTVSGTVLSDTAVCPFINQFDLFLVGNVGSILTWLFSTDGGVTWNPIANTTNTLSLNGLSQDTQYSAVVQSGSCNTDTTNIVTITIFPVAPVTVGNDTLIYLGESVLLNGSGTGTPLWSPGSSLDNPSIFNPLATPSNTTSYILTVTDANGCINADTIIVTVEDTTTLNTDITITNLFTPNGDGINDFWNIKNIENISGNEVFVYNIHGNLVFSKKNTQMIGLEHITEIPCQTELITT